MPDTVAVIVAPALPKLLATWCREYDWIVIDSPPAFVAETAVLAQQADLILPVARPGVVERANLRHAIEALERIDVPRGLVLNGVGRQHTGYYYGSGYYYYHSSYGRCRHRRRRVPFSPASPVPRDPPAGVEAEFGDASTAMNASEA